MVAVAFVRKLLHFAVLIIAHSVPEHRKKYAALFFLFDHCLQGVIAAGTHIKITVGAKYYAIVSAFHKILAGNFVSQLNTCAARR